MKFQQPIWIPKGYYWMIWETPNRMIIYRADMLSIFAEYQGGP